MASAISSSSRAPCEGAAQSGFTKSELPDLFDRIPNELILHIFEFLPGGLGDVACVNKRFQRLAGDRSLWKESDLKFRFPLIKNIFNKQAWGRILDLETLEGVSFEEEKPFNPVSAVKAVKDIHHLQVEGDAGYTVITMPQGLTINNLKSIIVSFAAEGKFPSAPGQGAPGLEFFSPRILEELGDVPVAESYTFAISNSVLQESRRKSYDVQRASVNAADCELPRVLEAMTLLFLTYMASGERRERLCSDAPWTFMRCLERVNDYPLAVGGFASAGLFVLSNFVFGISGAGFARKFF